MTAACVVSLRIRRMKQSRSSLSFFTRSDVVFKSEQRIVHLDVPGRVADIMPVACAVRIMFRTVERNLPVANQIVFVGAQLLTQQINRYAADGYCARQCRSGYGKRCLYGSKYAFKSITVEHFVRFEGKTPYVGVRFDYPEPDVQFIGNMVALVND